MARLAILFAAIGAGAMIVTLTNSRVTHVVIHNDAVEFRFFVGLLGGLAVVLGIVVPQAACRSSKSTRIVSWIAIIVGAFVGFCFSPFCFNLSY